MVQTKNVKIIALLMIYLVLPIHFSQLVYASSFSVQMPEYANSNTFSFNGTTSPNTIVRVYVNGNEFSSTLSDSNGFFRFGRVLLNRNSQNTVRLHGTDTQSGTTFSQDFTVISEDNPPEFLDVQEPPAIVGERFVQIAGTLSKNAHVVAIVNDRSVDIAADSSVFNAQVPLEEGENTIVLRATDRAGNTRQRQFTVVADTVPPRIVSTNIADISPTYTNQVTIRGEVSKPVRVAIVLNNDNRYACLEQAPVSPDCLALLEDDGSSRNLFVTETDSDGTFSKQINLGFGFDSSYTEASTVQVGADTSRIELRFQSTDATNHVRVIAIDRAGQVDSTSGDVTYSSCSSGEGDFLMFQGQVFPAMIIPDHVFQGIAQVSFEVELNYLDQRHTPEDIQLRVGTRELSVEDRESWSINLFDPARCIATPDDSGLNWYVNCALRRYPAAAYRNITEAYEYFEDKGFVKLPINLEITYTAPGTFADMRYGGEGGIDGRNLDLRETQITKTQIVCYDMEIALDRRVPPDKIPRSLLENTVEVLDTVIDAIDQILPYVQRAKLITFATCLILNVYEIFQNLGETAACGPGGFLNELTGMGVTRDEGLSIDRYINGQPPGSGFDLSEEDIRAIAHAHNPNADNLDEHINRIQTCASVKSRVKRADVKRQWVCDRIFCPMVPSFQKYFQDAPESSACYAYRTGDISVLPQSRTGGPNSYVTLEGGEPTLCEYDYLNEWNSACLGLNPLQESRELQYQDDSAPVSRALNLINGLSLCEFGDQGANDNRVAYASGTHSIIQDTNQGSPRYQLARPVTRDEIDQNSIVTDSSRAHNPLRIGFGGNAPSIFGSDPNNHYVTAQDGCTYMLPNVNPYSSSAAQLRPVSVGHDPLGINRTIHTVSLSPVTSHNAAQIDADLGVSGSQGYFVDRAGHLYRQIDADTIIRAPKFVITQQSGGDVSQFNARLHQGNERPDNCYVNEVIREHTVQDYLTDPTQGFINSVRCGCLPAIEGYLVSTKNILTAIKNCFESVLVTNEFDSGVCRAILTQYLCDFVFDLLGCFVRSFSMESGENRDRNPISNFFTDLSSGGDHIRERSQRRYGQSATFNALFGNRQLIHQVCLAAFGYDWKPDLEAALSMGGEGIEIDTVGIVAPATRQFMSYNPNDEGRATHVYHVGYFLSAGGDIRWTLDLVCSTTNECSPDEGFEGGWCDCARGSATSNPGETPTQGNTMNEPGIGIIRRIDGGQLRAGDTLGTGGGDPYAPSQGDLYVSLDDSVRYDKVRLSWTSNQPDGKSGEILVPIRQTGGRAPAQCTFSLSLLQYRCGFTSIEDGFVYIQGVSEYRRGRASSADVGTEAFMQNEPIKFSVNYGYQRPASDREEIPRFIRTRITDSNGNLVDESFTDYNQLRPGSGTVVVPFNDISATRIAGGSRAILRSSASAQRVQGSTVPQLSLSYNSFTFEGSEVSYLVFEHNPSSNTLQYLEIPRSALQRNGGALTIGQYMEQNSNLPKVTLTALDDSAGAFTLKTAEGDRTITASCPGTDPCKSYITLSPDQNAPQSITEVCQGRNGEPLRWGVEIQVMNGRFDDNNQATVRGATPTPSISTVRPTSFSSDILIHCPTQFEGTEGSSNSCPYDVLLSTRDAGCMCQSTEVTEAMLTAENAQVYCVPPDSYAGETTSQTTFSIANNPRVCPLVGDDTVFRTPGGSVARCAYDILVRETRVNGDVRSTDMLERVESRSDTEIASSQNALRSGLSSDQTVARRTGTCGSGQFYDLFVDECRTG